MRKKRLRPVVLFSVLLAVMAVWLLKWRSANHPKTLELIHAIDIGNTSAVPLLINDGARVNGLVNNPFFGIAGSKKVTPLQWAYHRGRQDIVEQLKKHSAHFRPRPNPDAVCLAVFHGDTDELRYLIGEGVHLTFKDKVGQTLLHYAAWQGDYGIAVLLVDNGCDISARTTNGGATPLHYAASFFPEKDDLGAGEIAELLISRGAQSDARNGNGETPLDCARRHSILEVAAVLERTEPREDTGMHARP